MHQPDATIRLSSEHWKPAQLANHKDSVLRTAVRRGILRALKRYEERRSCPVPYFSSADHVAFACRWDRPMKEYWDNRHRVWKHGAADPPHRVMQLHKAGWDVEFAVEMRAEGGLVMLFLGVTTCLSPDAPRGTTTEVRRKSRRRRLKKKAAKKKPTATPAKSHKRGRGLDLE